jgi:chromosome segregation ATPase
MLDYEKFKYNPKKEKFSINIVGEKNIYSQFQ